MREVEKVWAASVLSWRNQPEEKQKAAIARILDATDRYLNYSNGCPILPEGPQRDDL